MTATDELRRMLDELRKLAEKEGESVGGVDCGAALAYIAGVGANGAARKVADMGGLDMSTSELYALAGCIDSEMVKLPRDRDGVPIHVGDTVYLEDGRKTEVVRIELTVEKVFVKETIICCFDFSNGVHKCVTRVPSKLTHERPDSFERITDELKRYANDSYSEDEIDGMTASTLVDFADRIRKLAEREKA